MKIQKLHESIDNSVKEDSIIENTVHDAGGDVSSSNEVVKNTESKDTDSTKELTEGILGKLAFGNSLARGLYDEFYKELTDAISANDRVKAQRLLDDFRKDLESLKKENKRWHNEFIKIHEEMLDKYQEQINDIVSIETKNVTESVGDDIIPPDEFEDNYEAAGWDDYDDDYYDLDDVELDRRHAALYGGERMYCDCGTKRVADEDGYFYCPECDKYE